MSINNSYFALPINMDRVCRICLLENINLQPIFCNRQAVDNPSDLSQKIQLCGGIECQEQDGLPALICGVCVYKASVAFEFRQLCQHSDTRLRMYFNKPIKYNNATDSGTQTDLQIQALLTKPTDDLQNSYFVKEEVMNSQQYHTSLTSREYNAEVQTNTVVTTIESSMPTVDVNIAVSEEKLFNCHLNFDDQTKDISKNSETISCDTQSVNCTQELIPVTANLIDRVCTMDTEINAGDAVKHNVNYFTYVTKEQTLVEDNNLEKEVLDVKTKNIENNNFNSEQVENNYFETNTENQIQEETKYKCELCPKIFNTQLSLKKHQLMHKKQYKCEICFKTFCKLENLEKHKPIHQIKPHACHTCHACFSKLQNLAKHLKSHEDKSDSVEQQVDSEDINRVSEERRNIKSEDSDDENGNEPDGFENAPEIFKCEVCTQYCSSLKNLKRHALIHGERKYSCTVCKKWFFRPDTLKKHAEKHGHGLLDNISDSNKLYESDDDAFQNVDNSKTGNAKLKKNESENENNEVYKCQHCHKVVTTKKGLRRHVAMHKPRPEPAICEICKKVCASLARLALHQKTHKPKEKVPREYLCHICSKVYPSNSSLTYHMRTHMGIKPHVCKICNSGFTTTTSLANHLRIHTGDKPFVCHVCSAAFAVNSAFRRHLTRHTGEANYVCKTCGKAFKRLSTLKEHSYTHSGERPYKCKTCNAAYSHSGSLFAHQKRCKVQLTDMVVEDNNQHSSHHIHVDNVQSGVRSLAVINQMF